MTIPGGLVEHKDLLKLKPGEWVNDEIVNFIGTLACSASDGKVAFLNSHFYPKYTDPKKGIEGVYKWSKKVSQLAVGAAGD